MRIEPLDLDHTLGCGQAHRWRKEGEWWTGVVKESVVRIRETNGGLEFSGMGEAALRSYLRADDDLDAIYTDISRDEVIPPLLARYRGLRILRQDPWECAATYILATNANIPRIQRMIATVCRTFGHALEGGEYSFPTPQEILSSPERGRACGLGYRCDRFIEFARRVDAGELDLDSLREMPYERCVSFLKGFRGIGDKVADCVALFSLDHLDAFPVDVRVRRALETRYAVRGSYRRLSEFGRSHFGEYAGYAQQYLFLDEGR